MASVVNWRQFLISPEKGGGSLSCAVNGKSDGKLCGLLRVGNRGDTTVVMRSASAQGPIDVQAIHCSPSGCETAQQLKPITGKGNRYRLPTTGGHTIDLDINRPSPERLVVAVRGMHREPHILHYYGDRGLVTLGDEISPPSLMRGGTKLRLGRSFGYGMFATEDIKAGEIVEEAPVLSQSAPFLTDYTFSAAGKHILPLGNLALYNHSENPSCSHELDATGSVMTLRARRDIPRGSEMTITYEGAGIGTGYWFASRGIKAHPIE